MLTVLDLKAELGRLRLLRGRTPLTPAAAREGAFARLAEYRDGGLFAARFSGIGPWERHPNGDELVQVVDGAATMHLLTEDGPQTLALRPGSLVIVPQDTWHRFESPDGVTLFTATPQPTQHLEADVEDPRTVT